MGVRRQISRKKLVQLTGSEASEELTKQIKFYLVHNYNKWRQHKEMCFLKSTLDDTAVVSNTSRLLENYTNTQANAIPYILGYKSHF